MDFKESGLLARRFKRKLGLLSIQETSKATSMSSFKTPESSVDDSVNFPSRSKTDYKTIK